MVEFNCEREEGLGRLARYLCMNKVRGVIFQRILLLGVLILGISSNSHADIYDAVVSNANRSDEDEKLDARRKPADILRFFDVKPGMTVFDVFADGGYYTELLSLVVGQEGSVVLYNMKLGIILLSRVLLSE